MTSLPAARPSDLSQLRACSRFGWVMIGHKAGRLVERQIESVHDSLEQVEPAGLVVLGVRDHYRGGGCLRVCTASQ